MQVRTAKVGSTVRQPCLLNALICEFGGEATCVSMSKKLGRFIEAAGVRQSETRAWVQEQLAILAGRGDVTVEMTDSAMIVARVTETGVGRAAT